MAILPHAFVVSFAIVTCACVDRGSVDKLAADRALLSKHLLRQIPAEVDPRIAADLGGNVVYVGNLVDRDELIPGQPVEIRHFWQVVTPFAADFRVFTHLRSDDNDFMNLDDSAMRRAYPPQQWRAGDIIEDTQQVTLRPDWRAATATLWIGLVRRSGHRISDRLVVRSGPTRDQAVIARRFTVDLSKAPPPPGTVIARKAMTAIVIDGDGADPAWRDVPWTADFSTAEGSRDPVGRAQAKLSWDDEFLYLLVRIEDSDVASPFRLQDDPLWKADCIEVFIDADGNRRQYIELQVNPHNAQFDSYFATTRAQAGNPAFDAGMRSQVRVHGTTEQRGDIDTGWDVEIAIPWQAVKGLDPAMSVRLPPRPGDRFRLNVVRVDQPATAKHPAVSSWNRITYADFHALDRMLTVVFSDGANGATAPVPPASAIAPGSGVAP
jgi:hypothetical protein